MDYYQSQQLQFRVVQQQDEERSSFDKEPMFEKPLTPSDVGKLNRLVIPKQHAEKHFPLDGEAGEKDLLLSFEDEGGKAWRFRYSYWTSSQSYVLTKGWSRFVKEKQLDAGDVVLFLRGRRNGDRLYIGCRRRHNSQTFSAVALPQAVAQPNAALPWSPAAFCNTSCPAPSPSCIYLNSIPQGEESAAGTAAVAPVNSKQLRLFGVNLECGHLLPGSHEFMTTNSSGQ